MVFLYILIAVVAVSLLSLIGVFFLGFNEKKLKGISHLLVSLAVGTMLGGAFIHIMPEMVEGPLGSMDSYFLVLAGILFFFIVEKYFHWRHCHEDEECEVHPVAYLSLMGDGVHNFMDGVSIAAAFLVSVPVGIATTLAIMIHEIPQEISDYMVLIHSGLGRKKALLYNLLIGLVAVAGAVITFLLAGITTNLSAYVMPVVAGGFIYMAGTDLIPELHKERKGSSSALQLVFIMLGLGMMYALKIYLNVD
jgi:zinc and cadmium transporter